MRRDEALKALTSTDWTGATVEETVRPASIVHSTRLTPELSDRLRIEAQRRGLTPAALIQDLVAVGLADTGSETVTVRVADLHRAIDAIVRNVA